MNRAVMVFSAFVLGMSCALAATGPVETTMVVKRCIATDDKGRQCVYQAEKDKDYCWRHRGFVGAMGETLTDAGKGAGEAWQSTKQFSTNAWQKTKSGAKTVWDNTKDTADGARVGLVELLGGKDAKKGKSGN